jgi:hypothetical protein
MYCQLLVTFYEDVFFLYFGYLFINRSICRHNRDILQPRPLADMWWFCCFYLLYLSVVHDSTVLKDKYSPMVLYG